MKFYLIDNTLIDASADEIMTDGRPYIAVMTEEEWDEQYEMFGYPRTAAPAVNRIRSTKADEHKDYLTGTFAIPVTEHNTNTRKKFAFILNGKGIIFIDNSGTVNVYLDKIREKTRWSEPCMEHFLYDFMDEIIWNDSELLNGYERQLDEIERGILDDLEHEGLQRMTRIRGEMRERRIHYDQLLNMAQVFEENGNGFFNDDDTRFFHLIANRIARLYGLAESLRDYTSQLNDLYRAETDIKQNRIMTILTVISAIFMPLTVIVGWYGMNFVYMPELRSPYGYPAVILGSLAIVIGGLLYFRKKNWL